MITARGKLTPTLLGIRDRSFSDIRMILRLLNKRLDQFDFLKDDVKNRSNGVDLIVQQLKSSIELDILQKQVDDFQKEINKISAFFSELDQLRYFNIIEHMKNTGRKTLTCTDPFLAAKVKLQRTVKVSWDEKKLEEMHKEDPNLAELIKKKETIKYTVSEVTFKNLDDTSPLKEKLSIARKVVESDDVTISTEPIDPASISFLSTDNFIIDQD